VSNISASDGFSVLISSVAIGFQCSRPMYTLVVENASHLTSRECRMNLESAINVDRISSDRRPSGKKCCLHIRVCGRVSGTEYESTVDVRVGCIPLDRCPSNCCPSENSYTGCVLYASVIAHQECRINLRIIILVR